MQLARKGLHILRPEHLGLADLIDQRVVVEGIQATTPADPDVLAGGAVYLQQLLREFAARTD